MALPLLMRLSLSLYLPFFHFPLRFLHTSVCFLYHSLINLFHFHIIRPLPFTTNSISVTKISHNISLFRVCFVPFFFLLFPCFFPSLALPSFSRPLPLRLPVTPLRLPAPWGSNMSVVTHKRRDISLTPHYSRVRPHSLGRSVVGVVLPSEFNQIRFWIWKWTSSPACVYPWIKSLAKDGSRTASPTSPSTVARRPEGGSERGARRGQMSPGRCRCGFTGMKKAIQNVAQYFYFSFPQVLLFHF